MKKFSKLLLCLPLLFACDDSKEDNQSQSDTPTVLKKSLNGAVEKGPFVEGSTVTVNELDENLSQTGKTYTTTIINNNGDFRLRDKEFESNFVQLSVDGFYFHEITGELSNSKITLFSIADISNKQTVNVNMLTHLEKKRVEYLMLEDKKSFSDAKKQALKEILAFFGFTTSESINAEDFSIKAENQLGNILIAISVIMLEGKSNAQLTEFMSNFSTDLEKDGKINASATLSTIETSKKNLRVATSTFAEEQIKKEITQIDSINFKISTPILDEIEKNLTSKYAAVGETINLDSLKFFLDYKTSYDELYSSYKDKLEDYNSFLKIVDEKYSFDTIFNVSKADSLYFSKEITINHSDTINFYIDAPSIRNIEGGCYFDYVMLYNTSVYTQSNDPIGNRLRPINSILKTKKFTPWRHSYGPYAGGDEEESKSYQYLNLDGSLYYWPQSIFNYWSNGIVETKYYHTSSNFWGGEVIIRNFWVILDGKMEDYYSQFTENQKIKIAVNPFHNFFFDSKFTGNITAGTELRVEYFDVFKQQNDTYNPILKTMPPNFLVGRKEIRVPYIIKNKKYKVQKEFILVFDGNLEL